MAGSFYSWSKTPTDNQTADGDINWTEGQLPDTVNDSARQMMARSAEFRDDTNGTLTAGGSANAITLTANSAFTTLAQGRMVSFKAASSNTGATTINVNGLGSKAIRKMSPTGDVALTANDIRADGIYNAQYSTAANGAAGAWVLINPTLSSSALNNITSTDNAVARFDGTTGGLQNSLVIVDDNGNLKAGTGTVSTATSANQLVAVGSSVAGVLIETSASGQGILTFGDGAVAGRVAYDHATNAMAFTTGGTLAATLSSAGALALVGGLTATTGAFSGAVSGTTGTFSGALSGTTGTFSGAVSGTEGTFSSAVAGTTITASTAIQAPDGSAGFPGIRFSSDTNTGIYRIGADTIGISTAGSLSVTVSSAGAVTAERFASSNASFAIFGGDSSKTIVWRPQGVASGTNQMSYTTAGNLTAAGDITANSDIKLKKHVKTITGAVDLVKQLRGVRFTRRKVNTKSIGFIAQEVEAIFPELVHENENGKSVAYPNFVALLVEAVKELSVKVDRLESRK